jgi:hypothetical protein
MKIFATSDIHCQPQLLEVLVKVAPQYDLILYCGDVCSGPSSPDHAKAELEVFLNALTECGTPVRFIRGNCDNFTSASPFYLSDKEKIGKLHLVPFESILTTPFSTYREVTEEQLTIDLEMLGDCECKIIVAHTPPHGAGDLISSNIHVGSHSIAKWIEKNYPMFWLCGHVHEAFGMYKIGSTKVFNCASDPHSNLLRGWAIDTEAKTFNPVIV